MQTSIVRTVISENAKEYLLTRICIETKEKLEKCLKISDSSINKQG